MKITKPIGIKLVKMNNMDDIVGELFEGEDANGNAVIFGKDVFQVNVIPGASRETSLMSVTPWIPFADDTFIPIYYDSVVTIVTPIASFQEYYINIRNKWNNESKDEAIRSSSDRLDVVKGPTQKELEDIEREEQIEELFQMMMDKNKSTLH